MAKKILLAGESWISYTTHIKGFDSFYTSSYATGVKWIQAAMEGGGYDFDYMPNHLIGDDFPYTVEELSKYSCVILSDTGSNTFLLPNAVFVHGQEKPNRCDVIRDYVLAGGSLLMVGGYMTFSGIDAKGRWGKTSVQEVLPVKVLDIDDRCEYCEGIEPVTVKPHKALEKITGQWPRFLGYNKTEALPGSEVAMTIGGDPFIAFSAHGKGKSAVFTSDCAPHWGSPAFVEWKFYDALWKGIVGHLTG